MNSYRKTNGPITPIQSHNPKIPPMRPLIIKFNLYGLGMTLKTV